MAESTAHTFSDITERLDEIIAAVRAKDTSLERSLDLFDEAIQLGSKAVELVDSFDMSPEEAAMLEEAQEAPETDVAASNDPVASDKAASDDGNGDAA